MIGQAQVTEPLMTALRNGKIGHAYLFSGPRGCGKTSSARILARCLNCEQGPTDSPCGVCPSCVDLSRDGGGSIDVVEIDAASHGGVDDARELRERATFAPARDRFKVFIIDEAHMVSPQGFNALLKIVEEPPEHVKFVFATTEPEKVIGTIRSRTHHYPFKLIPPAPLLEYVSQLCTSEGVAVDDGVLPLVIRAGGGSARDTLSILDQLIAGSEGGRIGYELAVGLLGFTHDDLLAETVEAFATGDAAAGIRAVDRVVQTGQDPRRFVEDLLERVRDLIIVKATDVSGAAAVLRGLPEDQLRRRFEEAERFSVATLSRIADTINAALDSMSGTVSPRLHLELMIARIFVQQQSHEVAPVGAAPSVAQAAPAPHAEPPAPVSAPPAQAETRQVASAPAAAPAPEPAPAPAAAPAPVSTPAVAGAPVQPTHTPSAPASTPLNAAQAARNARAFLAGEPTPPATSAAPPAAAPAPSEPVEASVPESTAVEFTTASVLAYWPELMESLQRTSSDAWRAASAVEPVGVEGTQLRIEFPSKESLEAFKQHGAGPVREALQQHFAVRVVYVPRVVEQRQSPSDQPAAAPTEPPAAVDEEPPLPDEAPYDTEPPADAYAEPEPGVPAEREVPESPGVPETPGIPEPPITPQPPAAPEPPAEPVPLDDVAREPATSAEASGVPAAAPAFTRYGEAVVREMLGAKFIEERPVTRREG